MINYMNKFRLIKPRIVLQPREGLNVNNRGRSPRIQTIVIPNPAGVEHQRATMLNPFRVLYMLISQTPRVKPVDIHIKPLSAQAGLQGFKHACTYQLNTI